MRCQFIPSYVLDRLGAAADEPLAECGRRTVVIDEAAVETSGRARARCDRQGVGDPRRPENGSALPGRLVRTAGEPEVSDVTVNEAATGITESLALFTDLGRASYDDRGATVVATVHFERDYDNAFWDGTRLVFGDGDGKVFDRFTKPIDVLGRELARRHPVHRRPDLPGTVRSTQRVDVRCLRGVHQTASPRAGRCQCGLADR